MSVLVSDQPNSLGQYRYEVRVRGRMTHGFRNTATLAKEAGLEDQKLMHFCARTDERDEAEHEEGKPSSRRARFEERRRDRRRED